MKRTLLFIKLLILVIATTATASAPIFPRKLWTYSVQGFNDLPNISKLCFLNMQHYVRQSGYEFNFLTPNNYTKFLSKDGVNRVKKLISTIDKTKSEPKAVDIIRLFILYQNGGMWLDLSTIMFGGLSWVDRIKDTFGLYNNFASPQVVTFTNNQFYGGKNWTKGVYLYPGIDTWALIANKNAIFLKDWIQLMELFSGYQTISNCFAQTVLRLKEKELQESNRTNGKVHAVQYYKLWSIDSKNGPQTIQFKCSWNMSSVWDQISQNNLTYFQKTYSYHPYFIRLTDEHYFNQKINDHSSQIIEDSLVSKYLLDYGKDLQFVKNIKTAKKIEKAQSQEINTNKNIYIVVCIIVVVSIVFFMLKLKKKMKKQESPFQSAHHSENGLRPL